MSNVNIYIHYAGGKYVLASDYDRDTQVLKDELDNIKHSWGLLNSERDELRARVEAMLKQIGNMSPFNDVPMTGPERKCFACGEYHSGMGGLPCPKMTPKANFALQEPKP